MQTSCICRKKSTLISHRNYRFIEVAFAFLFPENCAFFFSRHIQDPLFACPLNVFFTIFKRCNVLIFVLFGFFRFNANSLVYLLSFGHLATTCYCVMIKQTLTSISNFHHKTFFRSALLFISQNLS